MAAPTGVAADFDAESLIKEYYTAWSGPDEDLILSYYADDVVLQIPGLLMEGRQAVLDQFIRPFTTAFPGNRHVIKNLIQGPGVVVVEFSFEAEHKGPFSGHAATGASITLPGSGVYQYDAATRRITAGRIYFDMGTLLKTITDSLVDDRTSERNLNLITNAVPTFIQVLLRDGAVLYVNEAVLAYTGLSLEEARRGDYRARFVHSEDVAGLQETLARPVPFESEQRVLGKDGRYRWFLIRYNPLLDAAGRVDRWYVAGFDIEDQKRTQEALRNALEEIQHSESKLRRVFDTIPALAWCNLPDGPNEFVNRAWLEYTGLPVEQALGWRWQVMFHPDDLPPLLEKWLRMLVSGEPGEIEARIRRHDGVYRWFLIRAEPFRHESGTIVRWYGTSTDIDDRKRAEALLEGEKQLLEKVASGRSLDDILDALCRHVEEMAGRCHCAIYLIDRSGTTFHNAAAPTLPASFNDPIEGAPVDPETGPCGMAASLKTQIIASDIRTDPRWPGSAFRPLALAHGLHSCWSTPILSLAGEALGTFAIYQEDPGSPTPAQRELITRFTHIASIAIERSQGEAALKRSQAFLAAGQRLGRTGTFSWRVESDEITWSDEVYRLFEYAPGTRITLELILNRVHPEDRARLNASVQRARAAGADFEYEHRLLMPDTSVKYVHLTAHGIRDREGRLEYIGAAQDVTERTVSEVALNKVRSELAHAARVMSLGAMTASIAHDVNQPIAAIVTSADACLRWLNRDQPEVQRALQAIKRIANDGKRAAEIITHWKVFYRKDGTLTRAMVGLNDVITEMLMLLKGEADRHSVTIRTELAFDLPSVSADRVQLQQVLMNLVLNGMEAMSERGGELAIRTRLEGGAVTVSVSDTGVGIPPDQMEQIFKAFHTTKAGGTGMGLAISRTIIEAHGGQLWATTNAGPGATFLFTLPAEPEV